MSFVLSCECKRLIKFNAGTEPGLCEDADNVEDKTYEI